MNLYTSSLAYFFLVLPEFVYFCFIFFLTAGEKNVRIHFSASFLTRIASQVYAK